MVSMCNYMSLNGAKKNTKPNRVRDSVEAKTTTEPRLNLLDTNDSNGFQKESYLTKTSR